MNLPGRFFQLILANVLTLALSAGAQSPSTARLPAAPGSRGLTSGCAPGKHVFYLKHDDRLRNYWVHVPPRYCDEGQPSTAVVLNLHGGGGNWEAARSSSRMDGHADREGYLVVFPEGIRTRVRGVELPFETWNAGRCCGYAASENVDDVGYTSAVLDDLDKHFSVDPNRVYATGLSNGGMMAYRLACELSDRFAAIAPIAGVGVFEECPLAVPVPTMHFHGTADPCEPYRGGVLGRCWEQILERIYGQKFNLGDPVKVDSVRHFMRQWRRMNGVRGGGRVTYQHGATTCVTHGDSTHAETEITLCTIGGGGHTWPGGTYGSSCSDPDFWLCEIYRSVVGPISQDIDATEAMWQFFQAHPKP